MEYFLYFCSQSIQTSMENKQATLELGTKPVGKLLVQYALPAMIAMTAASLYNIVDRVFIGQGVGAMAISGLAITFPFISLCSLLFFAEKFLDFRVGLGQLVPAKFDKRLCTL